VNASLLICGLLLGQPAAEPPVVGRPVDWSGAIGGPFVVTMTAEPKDLAVEERLTLTLWVLVADGGSAGNLRRLKRPALANSPAFGAFAVEDQDENSLENPPDHWFRYILRPQSKDVKEIPPVKFVYFNPLARRYQTTYSNAVPLTVKPHAPVGMPDVGEVPEWMLKPASTEEILGPPPDGYRAGLPGLFDKVTAQLGAEGRSQLLFLGVFAVGLVLPLIACAIWYVGWHRARPNAARLARAQRSRAAAAALHALGQAVIEPPRRVSVALFAYLRDRMGMRHDAITPAQIEECLTALGMSTELRDEVVGVLRRCDEARFANNTGGTGDLVADARSFILQSETTS